MNRNRHEAKIYYLYQVKGLDGQLYQAPPPKKKPPHPTHPNKGTPSIFCAMLFVPPKSDPLFFFKEQNKL